MASSANKWSEVWTDLARQLQTKDSKLAPIIEKVGPPTLELLGNPYQALVRSILSQQLAVRAAETITERFIALERPFPRPESILKWRSSRFRGAGVSMQKESYLRSLSEFWQDRSWRAGWNALSDEALTERLTEVKGIGVWTAHMFLIFSLGRPDVLPTLDFGVRRGAQLLMQLPEMPHPKQLPELLAHWKGASSVGSWYLWQGLDKKLLK